jgi:hypothetical protein
MTIYQQLHSPYGMKGVNVVNGNKYESFVGYPSTKKDFVLQ